MVAYINLLQQLFHHVAQRRPERFSTMQWTVAAPFNHSFSLLENHGQNPVIIAATLHNFHRSGLSKTRCRRELGGDQDFVDLAYIYSYNRSVSSILNSVYIYTRRSMMYVYDRRVLSGLLRGRRSFKEKIGKKKKHEIRRLGGVNPSLLLSAGS